jgi:hypothetical protein
MFIGEEPIFVACHRLYCLFANERGGVLAAQGRGFGGRS